MNNIVDQDIVVQSYLNVLGVKYKAVYKGEFQSPNGCNYDQWLIIFDDSYYFDHYSGIGHRWKGDIRELKGEALGCKAIPIFIEQNLLKGGNRRSAEIEVDSYAITPSSASVLYSLLLEYVEIDQSFEDWTNKAGYDIDSQESKNLYNNVIKLHKLFTTQQLDTLNKLLEDY